MGKMIVGGKPGGGEKRACAVFFGQIDARTNYNDEPGQYSDSFGYFGAPKEFDCAGKSFKVFAQEMGENNKVCITDSTSSDPGRVSAALNLAGFGGVELTPGKEISFAVTDSYGDKHVKLSGEVGTLTQQSSYGETVYGKSCKCWTIGIKFKKWPKGDFVVPFRIEFYD